MSLESATYVSDLVTTNPEGTDPKAQGDDHLRLLKSVLQASLPNLDRAFYIPTSVAAQTGTTNPAAANQAVVYPINATGGAITVNLPATAGIPDGYEVTIFKSDSSSNAVTIDPNSSQLINGAATLSLSKQYHGVKCIWLSTLGQWIAQSWSALPPYYAGGPDVALSDIAPSANAKRVLAATTATDWSEHTAAAILEFISASMARGDLLMRGASAFDRFGAGTAGAVLTSAGAAADLVWADPASQATMEAAASTTSLVTAGRQHFHPGHPKAGGNLNGTGTPAFRSGDYGMGAVTDNGTGTYTVAFDTSFANTNYWLTGWARMASDSGICGTMLTSNSGGTKEVGQITVKSTIVCGGSGGADEDSSEMGMIFWGDYA